MTEIVPKGSQAQETLVLKTHYSPAQPRARILLISYWEDGRKTLLITSYSYRYTYRYTVAPFADGVFMIGVSAEHRAASGLRAGDDLDVTLALDTAPRVVEVPPELAAPLEADLTARAFFDGLSYSNKRVFTLSVEGTSNPETKARRVEKAMALMREGRVR